MSTRHIAAEDARLSDLTPQGSSGRASKRFRQKLAADGFTVDEGFRLKPGYLYTVVRAISARVNQNYDGWPSEELKKAYKTFIGKPVFVNHENHDPTKARGVVVAARYVENGMDKYIEVVQEIDAGRFPKLAHEIKTGGLDSVSMGAEAGFTICSYCHNKATDVPDMCDHVLNHKGKTLTRFDRRTGSKEDVLVFESCHKISFFELSYVFEPADETAVASKVVVAGKHFASDDLTVPAPPGTPTVPQSVIDATPVTNLAPATELTGQEAPGLGKSSAFAADLADILKLAGECPPGMDCSRNMGVGLEQIGKDTPNNPVNQVSYTPGNVGQPGAGASGGGYQGNGKSGRDGLNPAVRDFYDQVAKESPDLSLGGYNPTVDQSWDEHHTGDAMDIMVSDLERGNSLKDRALGSGAKHVIWQQKLWYPGGGSEAMEDRGSPTENHYDHVHINMPTPAGYKPPTTTTVSQPAAPAQTTTQPAQRAAGRIKERLDFPWMHCDCGHDKRDHSTGRHKSYDVYGCTESGCDCTKFQSVTKQSGKYTKEDFAAAGGKKPWEVGTPATERSPVEEADLKEIEAMIRRANRRRIAGEYDDLPPLPADFHVPDSPEGQPDRSPGWLHRQFIAPHKGVWDIPEHELDDRWNKVYDTLGFDPKTRQEWESARHTDNPSDKWDAGLDGTLGGGVKDYLTRAPMSKEEYARHREDSKTRAKGIADGLWNALYPPEEEEGRKATQNMETVNNLMANGWQPEHIKYDEDDEPYAFYQHPSGWNVTDHGGMYKEIGHAATPGESHDVINVSRHDSDSGESHDDLFGPSEAHNFIEEQLHGDPEETGGTFQYLTQSDPRIRRYRPRKATRKQAESLTNPEHAQDTTRRNTITTYLAAHALLNGVGAPRGHSLDFGAGWGDSANHPDLNARGARFHTLEPYPNQGMVPDFKNPDDIDDGTYKRIHNLNVVNVAESGPRDDVVRHIGRILAPGGHAVITARGRREIEDMLKVVDKSGRPVHAPGPESDPGAVIVNGNSADSTVRKRYQKGFTPDELHQYVQSILGDGYTVSKAKVGSAPAAVHIIRNADNVPAHPPRPIAVQVKAARAKRTARSAALRKTARNRAIKLAWGEKEAPAMVDTLREEGSAPEDDNNDFERYVDPPKDLQTPDLSQAAQIDRQQELAETGPEQAGGVPGAAEGGPAQQDQGNFITLKIPMPQQAPQVPPQAAPPVAPQAPAPALPPGPDPTAAMPQQPPQQIAASLLDYFDGYYGRRVANWLDAIEANRGFTPEEAADYRRQAARLSTLENGRELSTTGRNPQKGTANMARTNIASRNKVATAGRRQHFAEGPLVDGGDRSRNDQGEQEEAFISQTPPEVRVDAPTDDTTNISNTEHNLVARVQQGRAQLLRDAQQLSSLRQRRGFDEAGGPTATVVDPRVQTGPEGEALTGDGFVSADPNDGVVPTNPKDASLRAFQAFDGWLSAKTGKSSRRHSEATIKKAAAAFSREAGISPQALFPALGIVLREARKNDKLANTKGAKMRKRADEKLEVAAPDGRIDVEAPVSNTTDAEAQASQFDLRDFGNNAGDNIADPDLSTDQNWAPGEAKTSARVKTAGGLLAMRCAEGMIAAGLEPNSRERKYQLAAEFEKMNRGLIQDRVALLERFASVREADRHKVASGASRGAARSPIPAGLGGGTRTAAAGQRLAAHDPRNDSSLFI